jgi:DNA-binding NarL/FixJ family response regulator
MPPNAIIKLALVDDHTLFRKGLISLVEMVNSNVKVLFEADNGIELQQKIKKNNLPDIVLMDVNMPGMDGFASVQWLKENFPDVKVLVISMIEKEESIVRMLKLGVKGYLGKDVEPKELGEALQAIMERGYYYTDFITGKLIHSLQSDNGSGTRSNTLLSLNEREKEFLQLACTTELTYAEIADKMSLSPKTLDHYRTDLFERLEVKSRVGMMLYAIKHGWVNI